MPAETTSVLEVGDRLIQFGYRRKNAARGRVDFARRFSVPPRVVVTPCWEGAAREVGHAETIGRVTEEFFVVYSSNAAANYFVSWIAIGYARGGRDENVDYLEAGDLILEFGRTPKQAVAVSAPLRAGFAHAPCVQASPFWENQRSGVGQAETVVRARPDSFEVSSDNGAPNYFVSWMAAGTRRTELMPRETSPGLFLQDFTVANVLVRTIRARLGPVARNISYESPAFGATPTIVVTPLWEGAGRGVTHAETIDAVEPHFVRLAAGNRAETYFVSMLAIGLRR